MLDFFLALLMITAALLYILAYQRRVTIRILELLVEYGPLHGLDLVKLSKGKLKRGTIYVWLMRMREDGLVNAEFGPDSAKAICRITVYGEGYLIFHSSEEKFLSLREVRRAKTSKGESA